MLYVEVMYHFNEQVDFKISSKLIQASKGYSSSKSLKQSLGGIWRCRITKTINKMSISAKQLYLLRRFFKQLTKNYIQSIPACKDQSFDPLSQ